MFQGQSGYLDHALASPSLSGQVAGVTEWHINADEPIALDYNTEFKTPNQVNTFYAPDAYRSSDHDPVLVALTLNAAPSVEAGGPYAVVEGSSVLVSAVGSDPDDDALTYVWDLDNDGTYETAGLANVPRRAETLSCIDRAEGPSRARSAPPGTARTPPRSSRAGAS